MEDLPISIGKIKYLKYLDLCGSYYLTHLPDSIGTLTELQTLKLRGCMILTLPDGITRLVNLRHLDLGDCWSLIHLPDGIGKLINLRHLDLSYCRRLTHLPDGIGRLMNLGLLHLSFCEKLTHLPDEITGLVNLEHLDISSSNVTQFPNGMGQLVNLRMLKWFSVGRESGQRITELQGLNRLRGSLKIGGLEHVKDAREAEAAILKNKKNLSSLKLIWGDLQGSNNSNDEVECVLEALQPPQSLNEKLVIEGYGGFVFANWMKLLENLVEIKLKDCLNCECLPPLGQLPLLKLLTITGMKSLKCIGTEFYGNNNNSSERRTIFPSLEELTFKDMPILDEWQDTEMMDKQQTNPCPCLKRLGLYQCPKLTSLPSLILSFVQDLQIHNCDKVIVRSLSWVTSLELDGEGTNSVTSFPEGSLQNLDALEFLMIKCYNVLTFFPDELSNLATLKTLYIFECPALQSLPVMSSSIVQVYIDRCQSLKSLSQSLQYLPNLEYLAVCYCDQLEFSSEDFQNHISLQSLSVSDLPKLTSFPDLQHSSKLLYLSVERCKNLIRLWPEGTPNLTVLQEITFNDCEQLELSSADFQNFIKLQTIRLISLPKLTSLPELQHLHSLVQLDIWECKNLKVLPQWLQNLTSLEELRIERCHHDLHSRCVKNRGEYWPFIKHIPNVDTREESEDETPPTTP